MHEPTIDIRRMICLTGAAVAWATISLAQLMHLRYTAVFLHFFLARWNPTYITHVFGLSLLAWPNNLNNSDHSSQSEDY